MAKRTTLSKGTSTILRGKKPPKGQKAPSGITKQYLPHPAAPSGITKPPKGQFGPGIIEKEAEFHLPKRGRKVGPVKLPSPLKRGRGRGIPRFQGEEVAPGVFGGWAYSKQAKKQSARTAKKK